MSLHEFEEWAQYFADMARRNDPNAPIEVDWENITPAEIAKLMGR